MMQTVPSVTVTQASSAVAMSDCLVIMICFATHSADSYRQYPLATHLWEGHCTKQVSEDESKKRALSQ